MKTAASLAAVIEARSRQALESGALEPIETVEEIVEDGGVRFVVRRVSSLARKQTASGPKRHNPFLPYDERLFVADVSDTHVALLNRFPVIERHVLVVTRHFADQERLLDRDDFAAFGACLRGLDALGFYNGGRQAGASQDHKHLQLASLPLGAGEALPIGPLLDRAAGQAVSGLAFAHAFGRCDAAGAAPDDLLALYRRLLETCGVGEAEGGRHSAPYNLLLARNWMLVVPRSREAFEGISINALGFAGSLFVRDEAQLARVRRARPMNVLRAVAMPGGSSRRGA